MVSLFILLGQSFGGGEKHTPKGHRDKAAFIKGVDTSVNLSQITDKLNRKGIIVTGVRRLTKRFTGKPTQVVSQLYGRIITSASYNYAYC